jgi:hypothetical protein
MWPEMRTKHVLLTCLFATIIQVSSCQQTLMDFQNASNVDAHGSSFLDIAGHQIYQMIYIGQVVQASSFGAVWSFCSFGLG